MRIPVCAGSKLRASVLHDDAYDERGVAERRSIVAMTATGREGSLDLKRDIGLESIGAIVGILGFWAKPARQKCQTVTVTVNPPNESLCPPGRGAFVLAIPAAWKAMCTFECVRLLAVSWAFGCVGFLSFEKRIRLHVPTRCVRRKRCEQHTQTNDRKTESASLFTVQLQRS